MNVDRIQPTVVRLTADAAEIAALISAAPWVTQGCPGRLTGEAISQLHRVLADYDDAIPGRRAPDSGPSRTQHGTPRTTR